MWGGIACGVFGAALITAGVTATRRTVTAICSISDHWIEARDGTYIHARLYVPRSLPVDPVPGIIVAHGYLPNLGMLDPHVTVGGNLGDAQPRLDQAGQQLGAVDDARTRPVQIGVAVDCIHAPVAHRR
jgi:hypothetical protein